MRAIQLATLVIAFFLMMNGSACGETHDDLVDQVRAAETAFAKSMADRDIEVFASFLADEGLFFDEQSVLRGKDAIKAGWSAFFNGETAPFSWSSESVEVLESGTLAHSSGPVFIPGGKQVGIFNSVWRREADGRWKVVFDKGCHLCD
jgi:ketosteroid isomerase-like protein